MDGAVAIVKLYGYNLGSQGEPKKQEECEAYWEKCAGDFPELRMGWFGSHDDPIAVVFHKNTFHEMYDAGAINKESCIITGADLKAFHTPLDNMIIDCVKALGFKDPSRMDAGWKVIVTTFPPEDYEVPAYDDDENLVLA
jgi:hypothetical protein